MTETQPEIRCIGYARVSTYGQTLTAQLDQLRADGCGTIYRETASGARVDRRELNRMLKQLGPGGVVTVTRIDRLARSTFDLFSIVQRITDVGGQFRSLAEPWADTATSPGRLMLAVLGGLADVERDLIRTRTAEGRTGARAAHGPTPPALTPQQAAEARQRRQDGATLKELAESYNVGRPRASACGGLGASTSAKPSTRQHENGRFSRPRVWFLRSNGRRGARDAYRNSTVYASSSKAVRRFLLAHGSQRRIG